MFTGIVEEVGTLRRLRHGARSAELEVQAARVLEGTQIGDSILTDGVCLTVTAVGGDSFRADAQPETVRRTTLASLHPGTPLNLERSLRLDSLLGGHLVSGHVDGVGALRSVAPEDNALVMTIDVPPQVARLTVDQGSLAVAGVSLTVVAVAGEAVRVSLIPHTAGVTTLGRLRPGDRVNLEADLLGRYVMTYLERMAAGGAAPAGGLTWDKLAEAGL